ncbi:MAG: transglutaminase family protein [Bacteroidetes bacterium]|nr:transglutaminase family protein [Bacteroidota bacterium]MCH8523163.1 transglutaminase-like domain-containing protein [Balneolales bacterium]
MTTKQEIASLLYLLEDPDEFVRDSVIERFNELDERSVPLLDEFRATSNNLDERRLLDDVILKLTFPSLETDFLNFIEGGVISYTELEAAVLMLSRFENPTLREEIYIRKLDRMAAEIKDEISFTLQPLKQMKLLMNHVFEKHGYGAAKENYFQSEFAHLHKVIDGKQGIPLTLSFIALFLARRLELPLSGVNMPVHFLMRYDFDTQVVFLDPFNSGKVVTMNECLSFLKRNNIRPEQVYFAQAHPAQMLIRTMRNLHNSYTKEKDALRAERMQILITHFELLYAAGPSDESDNPDQ